DDAQKRITFRMENGIFYTGKLISDLAAASLIGEAEFPVAPAVIDLCAGSGSLLLPVLKKLAVEQSSNEGWSYYDSLEQLINSNIYAIDKDQTAVELIRLNLAIDTARFGTPLIDSTENILTDDVLG